MDCEFIRISRGKVAEESTKRTLSTDLIATLIKITTNCLDRADTTHNAVNLLIINLTRQWVDIGSNV